MIKLTKKEKEIIAYILSLDVENFKGETQKNIINVLAKLQEQNIWGDIPKKDFN
mgnify:CR=1 FL=1|tara:strand:+ start:1190 stop:1351 length:162 start_codon:yes stop_codon:yes gene_type:complete